MAERNFDEDYDFDSEERHTFTLGGYEFHTPPVVRPGTFLTKKSGIAAIAEFLRRVVVPEDRPNLERVLEMPDSSAPLLDNAPSLLTAAQVVLTSSDDPDVLKGALQTLQEAVDRCTAESEPGPLVSAVQLGEVQAWLVDKLVGVPKGTSASSGSSSDGAKTTSNGSKAPSRKRASVGET